MDPDDNLAEAIELLQLLGLDEYAARCYVGLSRMDNATARKLSEATEVPRTRVYDATKLLEAQGLVEVHHSSPKQFRAVPTEEAIDRFRNRYRARFNELQEALNTLEPVDSTDDSPTQQVWSVAGREAIESRTIKLLQEASAEVVLALGEESLLTESLAEALTEVGENVELVIYELAEAKRDRIRGIVPTGTEVLSGLERLHDSTAPGSRADLGQILLVDQSASLISSIDSDTGEEQAVFSQGPKTPVTFLVSQLVVDDGLLTAPKSGP